MKHRDGNWTIGAHLLPFAVEIGVIKGLKWSQVAVIISNQDFRY